MGRRKKSVRKQSPTNIELYQDELVNYAFPSEHVSNETITIKNIKTLKCRNLAIYLQTMVYGGNTSESTFLT